MRLLQIQSLLNVFESSARGSASKLKSDSVTFVFRLDADKMRTHESKTNARKTPKLKSDTVTFVFRLDANKIERTNQK